MRNRFHFPFGGGVSSRAHALVPPGVGMKYRPDQTRPCLLGRPRKGNYRDMANNNKRAVIGTALYTYDCMVEIINVL